MVFQMYILKMKTSMSQPTVLKDFDLWKDTDKSYCLLFKNGKIDNTQLLLMSVLKLSTKVLEVKTRPLLNVSKK